MLGPKVGGGRGEGGVGLVEDDEAEVGVGGGVEPLQSGVVR